MDLGTLLNSALKLGGAPRNVTFSVDHSRLNALVPADSVFFSVKDILFNREYEFFPQFELSRPRDIIVDAGAHAGLYTLIASLHAKEVVALEPDHDIFQMLSTNVANNNLKNVVLKRSALWSENAPIRFYRRGNSQLGSIRTRKNTEPVLVDAISLDRLLDRTVGGQGRRIDLLKLDIEGTEFDVIPTSDDETLWRISRIVAEIHTEHGNIQDLTSKLRKTGFNYVIVRRPFRKPINREIRILADYKVKLMMRTVNLIIDLTDYSDWSSLIMFASRDSEDFQNSSLAALKSRIVETSLSRKSGGLLSRNEESP